MENEKKNIGYSLERKRGRFFFIGLCTSLSLSLIMLEWGVSINRKKKFDPAGEHPHAWEAEMVPVTIRKIPVPKPPVPPLPEPAPAPVPAFEISPDAPISQDLPDIQIDIPDYTPAADIDHGPFLRSEIMPEFPGGEKALFRYLQKEINYPAEARRNKEQATVYVKFVVLPDGSVDTSSIVVPPGMPHSLVKEAIRVVQKMPQWKPGFQQGHAVPVYMGIPIRFTLR